jgi:hypothetical protein
MTGRRPDGVSLFRCLAPKYRFLLIAPKLIVLCHKFRR